MDAAGFIKEHVGVFKDLTPERIKQLVDGSLVRSFETNEAIAHQGAEATHFGVVLSGTVAASAVTDGARQPLGQLKAGDTFAEEALMTGNPLIADFTAESHCEVLLIPVSLFQSTILAEPGAVRQISRTMADRTAAVLPLVASEEHLDPRAPHLRAMAIKLSEKIGEPKWIRMSERIAQLMKEKKNLNANVDFYSATVYYSLGIPTDLFTPIFAIARCSGWCAHVLEQLEDNRLYRPLSEYIGEPPGKKVIPIDQRP